MKSRNIILRGQAASPGIIESKVYLIRNTEEFVRMYSIEDAADEINRFRLALEETKKDLIDAATRVEEKIGDEYKGIFEAQILALEDRHVIEKTENEIRRSRKNADYIYNSIVTDIIRTMEQIDDDYLKDRIYDIKDILNRVLRKLKRKNNRKVQLENPVVLAANNFTPADLINIEKGMINGIICETGSITSHFSIMARALSIPAVVGVTDLMSHMKMWDNIIIDGHTGVIIIDPDETSVKNFVKKKDEYEKYSEELKQLTEYEAVTLDQRSIELSANIELIEELDEVQKYGARGIGLFRTEYIYFNMKKLPLMEDHLGIYSSAAQAVHPDTVIIRTVDIGGDKQIFVNRKESNPFLGFRGIRASLRFVNQFKSQLEAIILSNELNNVKIMLPIVSCVDEVIRTKEIIEEVKQDLRKRKTQFNESIELGIMIEVPSAALMAAEFAKHVDFFSIGTNDLTQYTLAVDRTNPSVADIYDNLNPAVLQLIDMSVKAAHDNHIWAGLCGEMASMPIAVPILIGMEMDELSMSPVFIPEIKKIIREMSYEECRSIANNALQMNTAQEVRAYMNGFIEKKLPNMHKYLEQ